VFYMRRQKQCEGNRCHTLKYLILGCEYFLERVHLSIGFSVNSKDFSGNYSLFS
jgi:hypothetical protein